MQLSSPLVRRRSRNLETQGRSAMARSHSTRKACIPKAAAHKASILKALCVAFALLFVVAHPAAAQLSSCWRFS